MAAEKETVEPVAQEQTIHVHDASGDEHIQPKPSAISTPAMVLEVIVIWISMTNFPRARPERIRESIRDIISKMKEKRVKSLV